VTQGLRGARGGNGVARSVAMAMFFFEKARRLRDVVEATPRLPE
jgi:hypothetical protein